MVVGAPLEDVREARRGSEPRPLRLWREEHSYSTGWTYAPLLFDAQERTAMKPERDGLMLKERVQLYNNMGRLDGQAGRLLAEPHVFSTPRIAWEFEVLGDISA